MGPDTKRGIKILNVVRREEAVFSVASRVVVGCDAREFAGGKNRLFAQGGAGKDGGGKRGESGS